MKMLSKIKEKCTSFFKKCKERVSVAKTAVFGTLVVVSVSALAEGTTIEQIGQTAAVEIAKFAIAISAVGAAVLSVVVIIQGFRMVFGMVKTAR